jgi:chorismate mutase
VLEKALQKAGKVGLSDEFITRYMDAIHMESINRQNKIMND